MYSVGNDSDWKLKRSAHFQISIVLMRVTFVHGKRIPGLSIYIQLFYLLAEQPVPRNTSAGIDLPRDMGNAAAMPAFAAAPSAAATPTIKLLIAKDAGVVVLAEAGKDVVDFLLGLLAMPLAAACNLTVGAKDKDSPLGALANLHASVQLL